jgi:glycerate kinase
MGVAERARASHVPSVCFAGGVTAEGAAVMRRLGVLTVPVVERPMNFEEVVAQGTAPLSRAAGRVAQMLDLAAVLGR